MGETTLETILRDAAAVELPDLVSRDVRLLSLDRKADTLIGMRRSGKTFAMFDRMRQLESDGVPRSAMLYLSLDDERLGELTLDTLDRALETFYRINPGARSTRSHLFFDEIQMVPQWERFIRRVLDTEDAQVVLSGSSAKMLSREVHTSLRGRGHAVEVLPFSYAEALRVAGIEIPIAGATSRERSVLGAAADDYLVRGGFPEVQTTDARATVERLHEYVEVVILRDVVERHSVSNIRALRHLVRAAFAANAGQFSVSSLHGTLVSQGVRVTKNTLFEYLDHLADAYLFFLVPIRTQSEKQRIVNPKKVYAIDTGLAAAMIAGGSRNTGALLENAVYLVLRRQWGWLTDRVVSYYRTAQGHEIDFVVEDLIGHGSPGLVQVCAQLDSDDTVSREARALEEAMRETGTSHATLVTRHDTGELHTPEGMIEIVPFWEWALRSSSSDV